MLAPWKKSYDKLIILKSRDIILLTKFCLVKAMVFPVVMYGCESWTIRKAERQRIDPFELWCWRRLLSPLDCKEIQPVHPKGDQISPGCLLEGLMLKLKLQYFGHLMRRVDSLEKTLMLAGIGARGEGDDRGWDGWMASPTWCTWVWVTGRPGLLWFMGSQRVRHDWANESNWTELVTSRGSHKIVPSVIKPFYREEWVFKTVEDWELWITCLLAQVSFSFVMETEWWHHRCWVGWVWKSHDSVL